MNHIHGVSLKEVCHYFDTTSRLQSVFICHERDIKSELNHRLNILLIRSIVLEKTYQSNDSVVSSVTTKLKGVSYTNISGLPHLTVDDTAPYNRIWDVSDYVIPSQVWS